MNRFNEDIPSEINELQILLNLDLGHNIWIGQLPSQLAQLQCLETLNISHNRPFGSIASTFDNTTLTSVDISYTHFEDLTSMMYTDSDRLQRSSFVENIHVAKVEFYLRRGIFRQTRPDTLSLNCYHLPVLESTQIQFKK
ncbi:hypothetical protein V6N13_012124 [Hibiscus sabdariffa]